MMRRIIAGTVVLLAVTASGPQALEAQERVWADNVCAYDSFNPCVDFELWDAGVADDDVFDYFFRVNYLGASGTVQQGGMTAAGLYDYDGDGSPFSFSGVTLDAPTEEDMWNIGNADDCKHLKGGGKSYFEGCVDTKKGSNGAVGPDDGYIQFSFTSNMRILETHFADVSPETGKLGARVHIQSVDEVEDCSYKLDSPKGWISGCGLEVPEPMTGLLLVTGLIGVGAVGYRNRRREEDEV